MRDWIRLRGMTFYAYHGVLASEQELGQRFEVDVEMRLNLKPAGQSDDLDATVDYTRVYQIVREIVQGQSFKLLERLAETIANAYKGGFPVGTGDCACAQAARKPRRPVGYGGN